MCTIEIAVVFSIGCNDSRYIRSEHSDQSEVDEYETNIAEIIATAQKYTNKILIVGLHTLHPDHKEVSVKDFVYRSSRIHEYNEVLKKLADTHDIPFVETRYILKNHPEMFHTDNLHLSDEGHSQIAKAVLPELEKLLAS